MNLVPNAGRVLGMATSLWAVYGALIVMAVDKAPELLNGPGADKLISPEWRDRLLGLCLILAPILRVIQQQSLTTATERKLQEERLTRRKLEVAATTEGPPLSPDTVQQIKRESAAAVKE
jgi:hypothetical protein